jgi:hypothetical protein
MCCEHVVQERAQQDPLVNRQNTETRQYVEYCKQLFMVKPHVALKTSFCPSHDFYTFPSIPSAKTCQDFLDVPGHRCG